MDADEISELKNNALKNSLIIAFFYVGLGTITAMSVYPDSPLYGGWVDIASLLTLPVCIVSFAIMYADPNAYVLVLIVQIVTFFVFWYILYRYLLKRYKRQMR